MSEGQEQPPTSETAGDTAGPASVPLSQADRAILALEGPTIAGHICKVIRLGPSAPPLTTLIETVAARLPLAPALTWKLTGPSEAPCWRPDPTFDLHAHLSQLACVRLDDAALHREVARLFRQRLDRDRPLWRIDLLGPLANGDTVLVWKVHHALADGATLMALARDMLWDPHPEAHSPGHHPHPDTLLGRHHHAGMIRRDLFPGLHSSPFDAHIGHQRAVAFATTPLSSLHDAAHTLAAATVNDAVLAVIAGALRRWLQHRHGALRDVRVQVPVSLHHEAQPQGNNDSYFCLPLPVGEPDPRKRLQAIRAATALRKTHHDAQELDELLERLSQAAPGLQHWAQRLQTSPRTFALNVSNVPGPPRPVSVLGAPVRSMHPLAELAPRHALRVAIVSVADNLCYGLLADPDVIADLDILAVAIEEETTAILTSHD
jgi:WS/DGAT C-terminal domain/Wax ester synthase/diacylglycerol acyltransferase catalytic domain